MPDKLKKLKAKELEEIDSWFKKMDKLIEKKQKSSDKKKI